MIFTERYTTPNRYPTPAAAKKARDTRARELRKNGYTVSCTKWDFGGLGYGMTYALEATK